MLKLLQVPSAMECVHAPTAVIPLLRTGVSARSVARVAAHGPGLLTFAAGVAQHFWVDAYDDLGEASNDSGLITVEFAPPVSHEVVCNAPGTTTVSYATTEQEITIAVAIPGAHRSVHTAKLDWYDWQGSGAQTKFPIRGKDHVAMALSADGSTVTVVSGLDVTTYCTRSGGVLHAFRYDALISPLVPDTSFVLTDAVVANNNSLFLCGFLMPLVNASLGGQLIRVRIMQNGFECRKIATFGTMLAVASSSYPRPHVLTLIHLPTNVVLWETNSVLLSCWPHGPELVLAVQFTTDAAQVLVLLDVHTFGSRVTTYHTASGTIQRFFHFDNLPVHLSALPTGPAKCGQGMVVCAHNRHVVTVSQHFVSVHEAVVNDLPPSKSRHDPGVLVRRWALDSQGGRSAVAMGRGGDRLWILYPGEAYIRVCHMHKSRT